MADLSAISPGGISPALRRAAASQAAGRSLGRRASARPEPRITPAVTGEPCILNAAIHAHLAYFGRDMLLAMSPFSCFRIPQIEWLWGLRVVSG
jgi:hypothetical protein